MITDYYKVYKDNTFILAKTLCIKSSVSADAINTLLMAKYGQSIVNLNDPTTWKYYLNISGQYHTDDTVMYVTSLDNGVLIPFTKASLALNPLTASSYVYGSKYFYTLLTAYPTQEKLILGILNPVDINVAISALDGAILGYPSNLVEPQEESLIYDLEKWIQYMLFRWNVPAFSITDSLYYVSQHAITYLYLVPKILNLRLAKCKTNEAHSFHIKAYLASHQGLDIYYDYLTLAQAMFLYRNILYLERNPGTNSTLNTLISNLLTAGNIPIAEYTMRHRSTFDTNYRPNYVFLPNPLNTVNTLADKSFYTLQEILNKEVNETIGNNDYVTNQYNSIDTLFKNSKSNVEITKILDSEMIDYTDYSPLSLSDALLNHWAYMSSKGLYNATVGFIDPLSGKSITLCTQDAFIYLLYVTSMSMNNTLTSIPTYIVNRVQKIVKPNLNNLLSLIDSKYFQNNDIPNWILNNQPNIVDCESGNNFYTLVKSIYNIEQQQLILASKQNNQHTRVMTERMVEAMYDSYLITFSDTYINSLTGEILLNNIPITGMSYTTWLSNKGLSSVPMSYSDCVTLINNLTSAGTSHNVDPTKVLANIQKAVIQIMKTLCSYSTQFLATINTSSIIPLAWRGIRIGDVTCDVNSTFFAADANIEPIKVNVDLSTSVVLGIDNQSQNLNSIDASTTIKLDLGGQIFTTEVNAATDRILVNMGTLNIESNYSIKDPTVLMNKIILGYEYYLALTDIQKLALTDRYGYSN